MAASPLSQFLLEQCTPPLAPSKALLPPLSLSPAKTILDGVSPAKRKVEMQVLQPTTLMSLVPFSRVSRARRRQQVAAEQPRAAKAFQEGPARLISAS